MKRIVCRGDAAGAQDGKDASRKTNSNRTIEFHCVPRYRMSICSPLRVDIYVGAGHCQKGVGFARLSLFEPLENNGAIAGRCDNRHAWRCVSLRAAV
jgi:hypothetical protein